MLTEYYLDGRDIYTIKIGQNKMENWSLIDCASPDNIWFHVSCVPSAHIVLDTVCNIKDIPSCVIYRCAVLCKKHSKSTTGRHCNVIYTYMKHVAKGDNEGEAIIGKKKSIRV